MTLILALVAEVSPRIRDPFYGDKFAKLRPLAATGRPLVVMVGTSRTGYGFHGLTVEAEVERRTGRPITAFNFGVPASGPLTHLLYARRMLDSGVKPDLLLVELLPSMVANLPRPLESLWVYGERMTAEEVALAERFGFPPAVRDQWRAGRLTPWHGLRFQLLGRTMPSWLPWHLRHDANRTTDPRGWTTPMVAVVSPEQRAAGNARAANEYAPILSTLNPGGPAADTLRELLAECDRRGVPVKLVWMPEGESFRRLYPPAAEMNAKRFLTEVAPGWIDARDWAPDEAFTDGHHLLKPGAVAFSTRLGAEIAPRFGGEP